MYQGGSVNKDMQAALEGALYAFGVDALFTGHVHSYERDYPVWGGQLESTSYVDPRATVHIMVGGAGNDEMDGSAAPAPAAAAVLARLAAERGWVDPSRAKVAADTARMYERAAAGGDWVAVTDHGHFGAGLVRVENATHLHFSYVRTTTGEVFDEVWIVKHGHVGGY